MLYRQSPRSESERLLEKIGNRSQQNIQFIIMVILTLASLLFAGYQTYLANKSINSVEQLKQKSQQLDSLFLNYKGLEKRVEALQEQIKTSSYFKN